MRRYSAERKKRCEDERAQILAVADSEELASLPPSQTVPTAADRDRVLKTAAQQHQRGRARYCHMMPDVFSLLRLAEGLRGDIALNAKLLGGAFRGWRHRKALHLPGHSCLRGKLRMEVAKKPCVVIGGSEVASIDGRDFFAWHANRPYRVVIHYET